MSFYRLNLSKRGGLSKTMVFEPFFPFANYSDWKIASLFSYRFLPLVFSIGSELDAALQPFDNAAGLLWWFSDFDFAFGSEFVLCKLIAPRALVGAALFSGRRILVVIELPHDTKLSLDIQDFLLGMQICIPIHEFAEIQNWNWSLASAPLFALDDKSSFYYSSSLTLKSFCLESLRNQLGCKKNPFQLLRGRRRWGWDCSLDCKDGWLGWNSSVWSVLATYVKSVLECH